MTVYCNAHSVAICQIGAIIDHKFCDMCELDDAILLSKEKLTALRKEAVARTASWKEQERKTGQCLQDADEHLRRIRDEVDATIIEKERKVGEKKETDMDAVNRKADEEIAKINADRQRSLGEIDGNAKKRLDFLETKRHQLVEELENFTTKIREKLEELQSEARIVTNAPEEINNLLHDDKKLLLRGAQVIASLGETLDKPVCEDAAEDTVRTVLCVSFVKGQGQGEESVGRINWGEKKWDVFDNFILGKLSDYLSYIDT